jgi:hypothetical protein
MGQPAEPFVYDFPLWTLQDDDPKKMRVIRFGDGDAALAVFTDMDIGERHIREVLNSDPTVILHKVIGPAELIAIAEGYRTLGVRYVAIDATIVNTGAQGHVLKSAHFPIDSFIADTRAAEVKRRDKN